MALGIVDRGTHIEVTLDGFATVDEMQSHFQALASLLAGQRARLGRCRVVVDAAGGQPQSADVAHLMSEHTARLYRDDDKVAVLVSSALLRMQIRRVLTERLFPTFDDISAARAYALS